MLVVDMSYFGFVVVLLIFFFLGCWLIWETRTQHRSLIIMVLVISLLLSFTVGQYSGAIYHPGKVSLIHGASK